MNDTADNRSGI